MTSSSLDNLVKTGQLKREPASETEIHGLISAGKAKLNDSCMDSLSPESRFDLSYNAAHALALAALRLKGYRSENRFVVFQCLVHTCDLEPTLVRVLSDAHGRRNRAEYEGYTDINESLINSVIRITKQILAFLENQDAT